jgi:hypothetical protein
VKFLSLISAILLSVATATSASAAEAPLTPSPLPASAASQPAQELDELDEVWVRGKRLSDVIEEAEDEFFRVYNKLNKNHDYDVHCGYMDLSRMSMAMMRTCVPGFIVYTYYDLAGRAVQRCSDSTSSIDLNTTSLGTGGGYYGGCTYAPLPPPELLAMRHRDEYKENVLKVIGGNERLRGMAARLAGLYGEMEALQNRYVSIKGAGQQAEASARPAKRDRKPVRAATGPRT